MQDLFAHSGFIKLVVMCSLLLPGLSLAQSKIEINCPLELQSEQNLKNVPTEFSFQQKAVPSYLEEVTFHLGNAVEAAAIAPATEDGRSRQWDFPIGSVVYVSCGYSQTSIILQEPLPANIENCTVVYDKNIYNPFMKTPKKITCNLT